VGRFSILSSIVDPRACAVYDLPDDLSHPMRLSLGERMDDLYPDDLEFRMAEEARGIRVPDLIHNALGFILVSARFEALLREHATGEIEFLPFTLRNHKGRIAGPGFLVNPIGALDCADPTLTQGTPNPILPGQLMLIRHLVLDEARIPENRNFIRLSVSTETIAVRDDLRSTIEASGMTGVRFLDQGAVRL
jgi:hypothetical protein